MGTDWLHEWWFLAGFVRLTISFLNLDGEFGVVPYFHTHSAAASRRPHDIDLPRSYVDAEMKAIEEVQYGRPHPMAWGGYSYLSENPAAPPKARWKARMDNRGLAEAKKIAGSKEWFAAVRKQKWRRDYVVPAMIKKYSSTHPNGGTS